VDIATSLHDMAGMRHGSSKAKGPSQRQLRAGELIRHALVEVLREEEINDPALAGVSVTVAEVRLSPDLRHATVFVQPLGGGNAPEVVAGLNRHAKFLRGRLGHHIELKFTPDLRFMVDESFEAARKMDAIFASDEVRRDLEPAATPTDSVIDAFLAEPSQPTSRRAAPPRKR
jgi:ribosome-binding factor A